MDSLLVGRSDHLTEPESEYGKMSVLETFEQVSVLERVLGGALGVDRCLPPLPTHLQHY